MNQMHSILIIALAAIVTIVIRFLPFVIFRDENKTPKVLEYLSLVLPGAIMGMLVIYCFKDVEPLTYPHAIPEIIATAIVVLLYLWKRNVLVSIASGTILYMALVQTVFI